MPLLAAWVNARLSLVIQEGWIDLREKLLREAEPLFEQCKLGGFNNEQVRFVKDLYQAGCDKPEHDTELKALGLLPKPKPHHIHLDVTVKSPKASPVPTENPSNAQVSDTLPATVKRNAKDTAIAGEQENTKDVT